MNLASPAPDVAPLPPPVATVADAHGLAAHYAEVMDALVAVVEQETQFVRAGKLNAAAQLEAAKTDLARRYVADTLRVKASRDFLAEAVPDAMRKLAESHDAVRAALQTNLTVLATAHAVSEGIVRGVSDELARQSAPSTYGASGQTTTRRPPAQPIALSRML